MPQTLSHSDPILIGRDSRGAEQHWCSEEVNNFNALFEGTSGSGKSHTIMNMAARVHQRGTTMHVIDIKGDFDYENFKNAGLDGIVNESDFNNIRFDYFKNGASVNPLQVPRTREGGGVLMTIEGMKALVKVYRPNTGQNQLQYLDDILKLVYADKGIVHDDESTWTRPSPDLVDLLEKIDLIFNVVSSGLPVGSVTEIMDAFGKAKTKADKTIGMMEAEDEDVDLIEATVGEQGDKLIEFLSGMVRQHLSYNALKKRASNGTVYEYWKKDSLYGLRSIISNMVDSRLFTGNPATTVRHKINRYDLTEISPQHQQVIMRIVAGRVFAMGVMETRAQGSFNPSSPNHILIADEGKHVKEISKSALSPFNRIGTEGRGYGVGIWCGVQQPDQVTEDLLKNFATYFLLKTPESSYGEVSRMFGVKPALLKQLQPRENVLYSSGGPYTLLTHFKD